MKKLCKTNVCKTNTFKTKVATIALALTVLSSNSAYSMGYVSKFCNGIQSFFTAKTNPILKPTPGIIQGAKETISNLNSKIKILQTTYDKIPGQIQDFAETNKNTICMQDKAETLEGVQKCISQYREATNHVINFIYNNAKKIAVPVRKWFGLRTDIIEHNEYPIHDGIAENGLTNAPEYLANITESQQLNLANFEKCVAGVPGSKNVIDINWFKNLIADKIIINKQALLAIWENAKYHTRGFLETITPNNPYLKYALIAGGSTYLAYKLYKNTIYKLWKFYKKETPKQLHKRMADIIENQAELNRLTILNNEYGRDNILFKTIGLGTAATAIVALAVKAFEMNQIQPYFYGH